MPEWLLPASCTGVEPTKVSVHGNCGNTHGNCGNIRTWLINIHLLHEHCDIQTDQLPDPKSNRCFDCKCPQRLWIPFLAL